MENKNHSPPLHQEPSLKQRGYLDILLSFVIRVLIRCNFSLNIKEIFTLQFFWLNKRWRRISFSTDENAVAQADVQLLKRIVESFIVEFDQGKFEEYLSSDSTSSKTMQQYRKVSSRTHSRISSEISPKVAHTSSHSISNATSKEVLKISSAAYPAWINVSQETRRTNASAHNQSDGEDQSRPSLFSLKSAISVCRGFPTILMTQPEC